MLNQDDTLKVISLLEQEYPEALCSLQYEKDYELLFSVRLSAQCTDKRVNMVTPALYAHFPTLQSFADASEEEIGEYIKTCGLFRSKAKDIKKCAEMLIKDFGGKVPSTMEELTSLPGVGRKTANLMLGDAFKVPGSVVVDTHCIRLTNRIGLADSRDPYQIEMTLRGKIPPEKSSDLCHRFVLHGRAVCTARSPQCGNCCLRGVCETGLTSEEQAEKDG